MALGHLADDELMALVSRDHRSAFVTIVDRYHPAVLGFATRFFGDVEAAEEVTQDVFLSLWAERRRYKPAGKLKSYLLSMTFHRACIVARRERNLIKKHKGAAQLAVPQTPPGQLETLMQARSVQKVRELLLELPPNVREVLILRYLNDLQLEEIADLTGLPAGTVKSHVFRGLKRLREALSGDKP